MASVSKGVKMWDKICSVCERRIEEGESYTESKHGVFVHHYTYRHDRDEDCLGKRLKK
jgi:hypothetical protein